MTPRYSWFLVAALLGCTPTAPSVPSDATSQAGATETTETPVSNAVETSGAAETGPESVAASTDSPSTSGATNEELASQVSCDVRHLTCKRAEPSCKEGSVPRIVDGCYAECVRVDQCVCGEPDACPQREQYTCNNSRQRCTPYLR